ncbi:MAG: hypothetical protein GY787_30895 [Alteromonadales bacterium]|nr:hypothetical protein [Alteromonadales bacterium]
MRTNNRARNILLVGLVSISIIASTAYIKDKVDNIEQDLISFLSISQHYIYPQLR